MKLTSVLPSCSSYCSHETHPIGQCVRRTSVYNFRISWPIWVKFDAVDLQLLQFCKRDFLHSGYSESRNEWTYALGSRETPEVTGNVLGLSLECRCAGQMFKAEFHIANVFINASNKSSEDLHWHDSKSAGYLRRHCMRSNAYVFKGRSQNYEKRL
jgi:hypothetical protein